jgi:hypothetical protein
MGVMGIHPLVLLSPRWEEEDVELALDWNNEVKSEGDVAI